MRAARRGIGDLRLVETRCWPRPNGPRAAQRASRPSPGRARPSELSSAIRAAATRRSSVEQHVVGPAGGGGVHRLDRDAVARAAPARSSGGDHARSAARSPSEQDLDRGLGRGDRGQALGGDLLGRGDRPGERPLRQHQDRARVAARRRCGSRPARSPGSAGGRPAPRADVHGVSRRLRRSRPPAPARPPGAGGSAPASASRRRPSSRCRSARPRSSRS